MRNILTLWFVFGMLYVMAQTPDNWAVVEGYPNLSPYHNSIKVEKGDSLGIIQFIFRAGRFPEKKDRVTLINQRKGFLDGNQAFDIIHVYTYHK